MISSSSVRRLARHAAPEARWPALPRGRPPRFPLPPRRKVQIRTSPLKPETNASRSVATCTSPVGRFGLPVALQRERERLLEQLPDAREELGAVGAVEDAVVADQRERHLVARHDAAACRPPPASSRACPTARIAAWGGLMIAVNCSIPNMPEVRDGERAARQLRRRDRACRAPCSISRAGVAGDLAERLLVGVEDRGHHERVLGRHRHARRSRARTARTCRRGRRRSRAGARAGRWRPP